ncbi:MAG: thioredoxin family protein [Lentisphaeria bacterium]|nr:thioredoxin family protein [Lentisphaeria bacterium]
MKKLLTALLMGTLALTSWANNFEGFLTSSKEAFAQAKEDGKIVFALFSGTDWCPPCMRLEKNVISKKEFTEQLESKYVFLLLDFPRYRRLKESTARQNNLLLERYKVDSFPTIVLIGADGEMLQKFNMIPNSSVKSFMMWFNHETAETWKNYQQKTEKQSLK